MILCAMLHSSMAHSIICTRLFRGKMHSDWFNGIEILQGTWQRGEKVGYCYPSGLEKTLCKWDIYVPLVTKGLIVPRNFPLLEVLGVFTPIFKNIHIFYVRCVVCTESKSGRFKLEALCSEKELRELRTLKQFFVKVGNAVNFHSNNLLNSGCRLSHCQYIFLFFAFMCNI